MKALLEKLSAIGVSVSRSKGDWVLFGLFLREDAPDRWDLIVSAPWISKNPYRALTFLAKLLRKELTTEELIKLSRIVPLQHDDARLLEFVNTHQQAPMELPECVVLGLPIQRGFLFVSRHPRTAKRTQQNAAPILP